MPKLPATTTDAPNIAARYDLYAAEARFDLEIERQAAIDASRQLSHGLAPDQMPGLPAAFWIGMAVVGAFYAAVLLGVIWLIGKF